MTSPMREFSKSQLPLVLPPPLLSRRPRNRGWCRSGRRWSGDYDHEVYRRLRQWTIIPKIAHCGQVRADLGIRLRELRLTASEGRLTGTQLADRLGPEWPKARSVSWRTQADGHGRGPARLGERHRQPEAYEELPARLRGFESHIRSWHRQLSAGHKPVQDAVTVEHERTRVLTVWENCPTLGIVRAPEYARHTFVRHADLMRTPRDTEDAVRARVQRREGCTSRAGSTGSRCGRVRCAPSSVRRPSSLRDFTTWPESSGWIPSNWALPPAVPSWPWSAGEFTGSGHHPPMRAGRLGKPGPRADTSSHAIAAGGGGKPRAGGGPDVLVHRRRPGLHFTRLNQETGWPVSGDWTNAFAGMAIRRCPLSMGPRTTM